MIEQRQTHFLGLLAYETWATDAAIASLGTVPEEKTAGPSYTRALQVIAHIQIARRVWLGRIEGNAQMPTDWFPAWKPGELRASAAEIDRAWHSYLLKLTSAELDRRVQYTSSESIRYSSTVHEILTHIFNHSTYHRGQVARLVTEAGGKRATTDFIAMTRKTL